MYSLGCAPPPRTFPLMTKETEAMTRFALAVMLTILAGPFTATAQDKPTTPRPPRRPDLVRPFIPDKPRIPDKLDLSDLRDLGDLGVLGDLRDLADDAAMRMHFDLEGLGDMAMQKQEMLADLDMDRLAHSADMLSHQAAEFAHQMPFDVEMHGPMELLRAGTLDALLHASPRDPWAKDDPADSLYRVAR